MAAQGTKVADVFIAIGGDLKGYTDSLKKAEKDAQGLGAQIRAALAGKDIGKAGIAEFISGIKHGQPLVEALRYNIRAMGADLGKLSVGALSRGLSSVQSLGTRVFGTLRSLASNVFKGFALGVGLGAFVSLEQAISRVIKAIPDLIAKGRDYANEVDQIVDVTGAHSREASILASTLNFLGQDVSTVFIRLGQLSKSVKANEAEMNRLGIVTRDSSGVFLNQVEILDHVRSAFSKMTDVTEKTRLEIKLFGGRGGLGQLVDYLQLTDPQMAALTAQFERQKTVVSDSTRQLGEEVGRAQKNVDNSFTGLAVTLLQTVGPQIVAFLDGLANAIAANAQKIADAIAGVVNTIIGLVQGLTGIDINFNSLTHSVENMTPPLVDTSVHLVELQGQLDAAKKKLKDAGSGVGDFNAAIEREIKAIDRQIAAVKKLGDNQEKAFRKGLDSLRLQLDAQNALIDAYDKSISRLETQQGLDQGVIDAERGLTKAYRDRAEALQAVSVAQADLNAKRAAGEDASSEISALADAQQRYLDAAEGVKQAAAGIGDAQKAIGDNAARVANEDRRAQLAAIAAYIKSVEDIVTQSENRKAALTTLKNRQGRLEDEIAAAKAKGNEQEAADLTIKLEAVKRAEIEETNKIKNDEKVIAFEKEKAQLEARKITATENNTSAIRDQIRTIEKQIATEKTRIAQARTDAIAEKALHETNAGLLISTYGKDGTVPKAFAESQAAGVKMAETIKAAIGTLMDVLLGTEGGPGEGKQGPTRGRKGGLLGGLSGISDAFGTIASGVVDVLSGLARFSPKDVGLGIAAIGVYFKQPYLILAGLALWGGANIAEGIGQNGPLGNTSPSYPLPGYKPEIGADTVARANATRTLARLGKEDPDSSYSITETNRQAIARLKREVASGVFTNSGYEKGGLVPGPRSQPVPIVAHGGEFVLSSPMVDAIRTPDKAQPSVIAQLRVAMGLPATQPTRPTLPGGVGGPGGIGGIGGPGGAGGLLSVLIRNVLGGGGAIADAARTVLIAMGGPPASYDRGGFVPQPPSNDEPFAGAKAYATGGPVEGRRGAAVPIVAHAGEYVISRPKVDLADRILGALERFNRPAPVFAGTEGTFRYDLRVDLGEQFGKLFGRDYIEFLDRRLDRHRG